MRGNHLAQNFIGATFQHTTCNIARSTRSVSLRFYVDYRSYHLRLLPQQASQIANRHCRRVSEEIFFIKLLLL